MILIDKKTKKTYSSRAQAQREEGRSKIERWTKAKRLIYCGNSPFLTAYQEQLYWENRLNIKHL